ncbi:DNA-binding GntR family transcriptional regulator [Microbacterium sp. W4I4]|uniref:GntR family transcriptional regulator n=1 Tax=Microbacterium sp. W4I4 TaxID=3042295 RepID=UPI0027852EFA|nr:GntR family transcriptional regulator [Microbacterium sp. W4I4]MDQ0613970.1 DNA-binding GntR family transcriptional regulator [Microbacterium sp. W4I4]
MVMERTTQLESTRVAEILREDILFGRRLPGSRLVERDIAAELQVSRLPVREAIRDLVSDGIVIATPRTWAVVRTFSAQDLQDFAQVREAMETLSFELATQRAGESGLRLLESIVGEEDAAAAAGDVTAARMASTRFHMTAVHLAHNAMLSELAGSLVTRLRWLFGPHDDLAGMAVAHREILTAMQAGDVPAIRRLIPAHLAEGRIAAEQRLFGRHDEID